MGLRFAPLRCPVPGLGADLSGAGESYRHEHTEEESTDVGEERDTTAARARGVDQRGVTLEELVEEPAPEEDPRRDVDPEYQHKGVDARVGIEHEIGAQHGGDRPAGAKIRYLRVGRGAE